MDSSKDHVGNNRLHLAGYHLSSGTGKIRSGEGIWNGGREMTLTAMHEQENDEAYNRMCCIGTWLLALVGAVIIGMVVIA